MPRVFTGKVVIPGDQLDAHFAALAGAEEARKPFRSRLTGMKSEFENYLATKYSRKTARKHALVVEIFIDFLCDYTDVASIEEVTRGMANSAFRRWYKSKVWDSSTRTTCAPPSSGTSSSSISRRELRNRRCWIPFGKSLNARRPTGPTCN
jgi:hypothetical protein